MRDRGQAVMLMLAVVVCAALVAIGVARLGGVLVEQQKARNAADAAALAAVDGGAEAAARLAAVNGATLVSVDLVTAADGSTTATVTVRVGEAHARARASNGD